VSRAAARCGGSASPRSPTTRTPGPAIHDQTRNRIEAALSKLQDARDLEERDSLHVEKWVAWYDSTLPLVTAIKTISDVLDIILSKLRGELVVAEGERRGRPSADKLGSSPPQ
jgi:hypothetical protein